MVIQTRARSGIQLKPPIRFVPDPTTSMTDDFTDSDMDLDTSDEDVGSDLDEEEVDPRDPCMWLDSEPV